MIQAIALTFIGGGTGYALARREWRDKAGGLIPIAVGFALYLMAGCQS